MTDHQHPDTSRRPTFMWSSALKESGLAVLAAILLIIVAYALAFRWIYPEFSPFMGRNAASLIAEGKDLTPVSIGEYRVDGGKAVVEAFNIDEAILALVRPFHAEDYPFINLNLEGFTSYSKLKILWRRAEQPSKIHALEANRKGDGATQISMVYGGESYRGEIADIALLFYDGPSKATRNNNDADIVIRSIALEPFTYVAVFRQIFQEWTNAPLLAGNSNNVVIGTNKYGLVSPNLIGVLIFCLASLLVFVMHSHRLSSGKGKEFAPRYAVICCVFAWAIFFNETLRWQWRSAQLIDSIDRFAGRTLEEKAVNSGIRCARAPDNCRSELLPFF